MKYTDYLDKRLEKKPFESGLEETVAYLGWLDMFLAAYAESRDEEKNGATDYEELRKELRKGAQYLYHRQRASAGKMISMESGIGISSVAAAFELQDYPFFCLLLAIAPSIDEHYALGYRALREDMQEHDSPTFALAESLYSLIATDNEMLPARRSINTISACPLFDVYEYSDRTSDLLDRFTANRQLISILKGDYEFQGVMKKCCSEYLPGEPLPELLVSKEECGRLHELLAADDAIPDQLIHITGARGSGRKFLVAHAVEGQTVLYVNIEKLLQQDAKEAAELLKSILVRAACLDSLLVLSGASTDKEHIDVLKSMLDLCFQVRTRVVLTSQTAENMHELAGNYQYFHINIPPCKVSDRKLLWESCTKDYALDETVSIEQYANKYRFTPGVIRECIGQASMIALSRGDTKINNQDMIEAIRHFNSSKLAELAVRIEPHFDWDDIEMDEQQKDIMRLACARAGLGSKVDEEWGFEKKVTYGKGMSVLLYGPPGTGKTMAVQIMAKEIGMELYRVDLSQMVDKYIGETEKNLGRIFDCAKEGNFILFFDEADSMFTQRTDVRDSNDKHANNETSYLLQKMEEYDGIMFLATNRFDNFDAAFVRRITYTVKVEKPDAATRLRLFQSILPREARVDEKLDFEFFANQFELTGSNIKAVLYNAAFMAAAQNRGICNEHIVKALKYEYTKLGKMVMAAEFGVYARYLL